MIASLENRKSKMPQAQAKALGYRESWFYCLRKSEVGLSFEPHALVATNFRFLVPMRAHFFWSEPSVSMNRYWATNT